MREVMLILINRAREDEGKSPLELSDNEAAQIHAEDMALHCYLSHIGRDGSEPSERYVREGGRTRYGVGENISGNDFCYDPTLNWVQRTLAENLGMAHWGLMDSPGHRQNILRSGYDRVALGFAYRYPTLWVVQLFIDDRYQ